MFPVGLVLQLGGLALAGALAVGAYHRWETNVAERAVLEQTVTRLGTALGVANNRANREKDRADDLDKEAVKQAKRAAAAEKGKRDAEEERNRLQQTNKEVDTWYRTVIPAAELERLCRLERDSGGAGAGACRDVAPVLPTAPRGTNPAGSDRQGPDGPAGRMPSGGEASQHAAGGHQYVDRYGGDAG